MLQSARQLYRFPLLKYTYFVTQASDWLVNMGDPKPATVEEKHLSKSKLRKMRKKEAEKKRREEYRKEKQAHSFENKSDVIDLQHLHQECYYASEGLRKVYPYDFTYTSYAKGRWLNRKISDVFYTEFNFRTLEEIDKAITSGQMTVNGKTTTSDYLLKDNDLIQNRVHRHELPVTLEEIEIVADTDQLLVVNKPSSIPVHPCGRYRLNSVVYILAKEKGYTNLRGVHRLDRLTSGVLIFGKSEGSAREMITTINQREAYKEYICLVEGCFPSGEVVVDQPLLKLSHHIGLMKVDSQGKPAKTTFECLATRDGNSLVKCVPHTGRTHQIRVHLQWLGHPIVNDPLYNGDVWGPNKGRHGDFGKSDEQLVNDIKARHNPDAGLALDQAEEHAQETPCKKPRLEESDCSGSRVNPSMKLVSLPKQDASRLDVRADCVDCQKNYADPAAESLVMYLHALKYKGPDWEFSTELPYWAQFRTAESTVD